MAEIKFESPRPQRLLPPKEWVERQLGNLKAVGETNYKVRVRMPKRMPIDTALERKERYKNEMKKALEEGRWEIGLEAASNEEWLGYTLGIGAGRLVDGVTMREPEVRQFVDNWHPLLSDHVSKIDQMKVDTLADRKEKMIANMEGLAALHGAVKKKIAGRPG